MGAEEDGQPVGAEKYKPIVVEGIIQKRKTREIYSMIRKEGYQGSHSTLQRAIRKWKGTESGKKTKKERLERRYVISLLYKEITKIPDKVRGLLEKYIKNAAEQINEVIDLVYKFRNIMKEKRIEVLDTWIKKAMKMNIPELTSFVRGIENDKASVQNAITMNPSNGLTEGKVNKLKVVKRVMYGRCSVNLLRKKLLLLEYT